MGSLLLNDVPMPLLARLRERVAADRRTLDGQVIWSLEQSLREPEPPSTALPCDRAAQLAAWRAFADQWRGSLRETDAVIADISVTGNLRHYNRLDGLPLENWIRPPPASAAAEPETGQAPTAADSPHQDD
jgi:hypothetical protein